MRASGHTLLRLGLLLIAASAAPVAAQTVRISPASVTIPALGSRRLTAYVNGSPNYNVSWSVNGVPGGNEELGRIDGSGRYTAPLIPPSGWTVTATATSRANPAAFGSAAITVRHPTPWATGLIPNKLPLGPFTVVVRGNQFVSGARVLWNGAALPTTYVSAIELRATGEATQYGTVRINVANPGPESLSAALYLSVRAAATATRTVAPSATRTIRPTTIATATRTATITRTATRAPATRTNTPLPTATATLRSATATSPPTRTATSVPSMTATAVRTSTTVPTATATIARTSTMMPSATASAMRTATMMPSMTATMMRTATMMPSQTATMMRTLTAVPTATAVSGSTRTATRTVTTPTALPTPVPADPLTITYGRLLDQASFGPTTATMARIGQLGVAAFIEEQLAMPESPWPPLADVDRTDAIEAFFGNARYGQDQLRQRVIYALSEIVVESSNKNTNADEIVPWLQLLSRNAFGNYRTLLAEITIDGSMGKFLDLANSGLSGAPNENLPRELMQLFSLGVYRLNQDGSLQLDAQNMPIPTYSQADVQQLARALTGWTWGNSSGTPPNYGNYNYYPGPMLPVAAYHNKTAKTILGRTLPANQTAQQDLEGAIDIIFEHPNVGPFIATRLIRALVTSNPTPAYISRVAAAFNGSGGVRGDMKAVIRAILLDAEARNDTPPANFGRLRTPVQHTIALARALNLELGPVNQFAYLFGYMNEGLLDAPSVFGHYSPLYRIPLTSLFGPEFQIYSSSDAINRANLFYNFFYSPWPIDPALQPFVALAGNHAALVTAVDNALLYGRMLPSTRAALLTALPAMPDNNARAMTVVYITSMCGEYLVQR